MDDMMIILLALFEGPATIEKLALRLGERLEDECPWSVPVEINDLGITITEMSKASNYISIDNNGVINITTHGIDVLTNSRLLNFIYVIKGLMMD